MTNLCKGTGYCILYILSLWQYIQCKVHTPIYQILNLKSRSRKHDLRYENKSAEPIYWRVTLVNQKEEVLSLHIKPLLLNRSRRHDTQLKSIPLKPALIKYLVAVRVGGASWCIISSFKKQGKLACIGKTLDVKRQGIKIGF